MWTVPSWRSIVAQRRGTSADNWWVQCTATVTGTARSHSVDSPDNIIVNDNNGTLHSSAASITIPRDASPKSAASATTKPNASTATPATANAAPVIAAASLKSAAAVTREGPEDLATTDAANTGSAPINNNNGQMAEVATKSDAIEIAENSNAVSWKDGSNTVATVKARSNDAITDTTTAEIKDTWTLVSPRRKIRAARAAATTATAEPKVAAIAANPNNTNNIGNMANAAAAATAVAATIANARPNTTMEAERQNHHHRNKNGKSNNHINIHAREGSNSNNNDINTNRNARGNTLVEARPELTQARTAEASDTFTAKAKSARRSKINIINSSNNNNNGTPAGAATSYINDNNNDVGTMDPDNSKARSSNTAALEIRIAADTTAKAKTARSHDVAADATAKAATARSHDVANPNNNNNGTPAWKAHSPDTAAAAKSDAIEVAEKLDAFSWKACSFGTAAAANSNAVLKGVKDAAANARESNINIIYNNNNNNRDLAMLTSLIIIIINNNGEATMLTAHTAVPLGILTAINVATADAATAAGVEANNEGACGSYINNINTSTSFQSLNATAAPATAKETTGKYPRGPLDVHVEKAIAVFKASTSWANFVTSVRGRGDLYPGVKGLLHSAAHLLSRFQRSGTPTMMKRHTGLRSE